MKAEIVANYLSSLKSKTGLTYEAIAEKSKRSESTVKNLCLGKAEDPRIDSVAPVVYALGGSMDEMLNPGKSKDELKEVSVAQLREMYEVQIATMKETSETHINNIRSHYEQHHEDLRDNYEKRLADKSEIIDLQNKHIKKLEEAHQAEIKKLEEANKAKTKISTILSSIFIALFFILLIMEFLHPEHGWIRF